MRRDTAAVLAGYMAFMALVFWACGTRGPNGPSSFATPVPIGPKPIPVGPAPRPVGPSGGPGAGPSGEPSGTPSPGSTPTPTPCAARTLTYSGNTPYEYIQGGGAGPEFTVDAPGCRIAAVRVSVRYTSNMPLDQILAGDIGFHIRFAQSLIHSGLTIEANTFELYGDQQRVQGAMEIGSSCGSLRFADGAADFATAGQPFDGSYAPYGSVGFPGAHPDSFGDYIGDPASGNWTMATYFTSYEQATGRVTMECWSVQLDVVP